MGKGLDESVCFDARVISLFGDDELVGNCFCCCGDNCVGGGRVLYLAEILIKHDVQKGAFSCAISFS